MKTTITAALMIAVFALTTAAVAGTPASATRTHHTRRAPPFSMTNCLRVAERIYGPTEARAACSDLRAGV